MDLFTLEIPANAYADKRRLKVYLHAYSGSEENWVYQGSSSLAFYAADPSTNTGVPSSVSAPSNPVINN